MWAKHLLILQSGDQFITSQVKTKALEIMDQSLSFSLTPLQIIISVPQCCQLPGHTRTQANNHSFAPNCNWTNADHPCFGFVPSITTIKQVNAGEELTVHYMMDMEDAPEWYMECWDLHSNSI
jgi:hypothetical protein